MTRCHIIAEAGTNHGGSVDRARSLVDHAADAGADSVKFQIIHPDGLYLENLWQDGELVRNEVFDARLRQMLPDDAWQVVADHARSRGIGFGASVFDRRGLEILDEVDADYIKIASCDLNNGPLITEACKYERQLIVSTGMSSGDEVAEAVGHIEEGGATDPVLMHCTSVYPCPTADAQLGFIPRLSTFGRTLGFSDHTEQSIAAAAALAMGITWIEKHITDDRQADGFDHGYAMEPDMMQQYIADVRAVELALEGDRRKPPTAEMTVRSRARRGLWAARDLPAGTTIAAGDVALVRPEGPLAPNDLQALVGRTLKTALRQSEPFTPDAVDGRG